MKKSGRKGKPKVIFDPSTMLKIEHVDIKQEPEDEAITEEKAENPWNVHNFDSFLFYECPECPHKSQDCRTFANHAAKHHKEKATDFLLRMLDESIIDLEIEPILKPKEVKKSKESDTENESIEAMQVSDSEEAELTVTLEISKGLEESEVSNDSKELGDSSEKKKIKRDPGITQCYVCGVVNGDSKQIIEHITKNHFEAVKKSMYGKPLDFQCQKCNVMFKTGGALGLHQCGILPPRWTGDYFGAKRCHICEKAFKRRYDLLSHITKVHNKEKNFACAHCDYKASVPFLLTKHLRRMHSQQARAHLCQDCGAQFTEKTYLLAHIRNVHGVKEDMFCYHCGIVIKSPTLILEHVKEVHGSDSNRPVSNNSEKPFQCATCSEEFKTVDEIRTHLRTSHRDLRPEGETTSNNVKYKYACPHCPNLLSNKDSLEHHINRVHELTKKYPCTLCDEAFFDSRSLKKHERKHTGLDLVNCGVCGKEFANKTLFDRHYKTVHEKSKEYACETCDFKTFHAYSLKAHVQQVHEKYRPNRCDYCEKAFFSKRDLEKHYNSVHQVYTTVTYAVLDL